MFLMENNQNYKEKAILLIKDAEGFRSYSYLDPYGNLTIGYGFNLNNIFFRGSPEPMSESQGDKILQDYCNKHIFNNIKRFIDANLNNNQLAVVCDMMYNLGFSGFNEFNNFIGFLLNGEFNQASEDLNNTLWYSQVGLRGIRDKRNLILDDNQLYLINPLY